MTDLWWLLTAVTGVLCAASGGAFLTYSTFTTAALGRLPPSGGLAAMQQVNLAAPRRAARTGAALLRAFSGGRTASR